jgi:hypothetical protein
MILMVNEFYVHTISLHSNRKTSWSIFHCDSFAYTVNQFKKRKRGLSTACRTGYLCVCLLPLIWFGCTVRASIRVGSIAFADKKNQF